MFAKLAIAPRLLLIIISGLVVGVTLTSAQAGAKLTEFHIKPSMTDLSIYTTDDPHMVLYDPQNMGSRLLVYLTGSGNRAQEVSSEFYQTAVQLGYRILVLTYPNRPKVSQVCVVSPPSQDCSGLARRKRAFGNDTSSLIADSPADAISNRLRKVLQYLNKMDRLANWSNYLIHDDIQWRQIVLVGQGEGANYAAYIAKFRSVARVILLSIIKDNGTPATELAPWYSEISETPNERWHACYHYLDPDAATQASVYRTLKIPDGHIVLLHDQVPKGMRIHPAAVGNPEYKPQWYKLLGHGN